MNICVHPTLLWFKDAERAASWMKRDESQLIQYCKVYPLYLMKRKFNLQNCKKGRDCWLACGKQNKIK